MLILQIYVDYRKRLGAYKITHILQRDYGICINIGRVYRLMKTLRLPRMSTEKPYKKYRQSDKGEYTDHLQQEFNQNSPNVVWVSDFTYIKGAGKWYYLCIVMDLFSRKIISWNISGKPDVDLVMTTFKKRYPFDNACCECFFKYLKKEEVHRKSYHSLHDLELSIFEYIEGFYNSKRPHASLGMLTPNEKEKLFWNQL